MDKQGRPRSGCSWKSSLIKIYIVCHYICIFWKHYCISCMVEQNCSNSRIITANFSDLNEPPNDKINKRTCAPSKESDQPRHLPSLIRVFAVRIKKPWILSYPLNAQWRLWLDWADTQADLSLRWVHRSFCWFCHVAAQMIHIFLPPCWSPSRNGFYLLCIFCWMCLFSLLWICYLLIQDCKKKTCQLVSLYGSHCAT